MPLLWWGDMVTNVGHFPGPDVSLTNDSFTTQAEIAPTVIQFMQVPLMFNRVLAKGPIQES